ncbi:MAG: AraC family transcriptional regulator [Hymenobacter sp.]|nr:MAG: AraC family transcriptional regulator [Hymenobacter sp.]
MRVDGGQLWYIPELPELELLTGRYSQHVFPWHFHDTYCISLQEQGSEEIVFAQQVLQVRSGMILVINPGEAHSNYNPAQLVWHYRSLYVPATLLQAVASWGNIKPHFPAKLLDDPLLFQLLLRAHQQLELEGFSPQNQTLLEQGLATLVRRYAQPALRINSPSTLTRLPEVLTLLEQQLSHKLSITDLAAEAGLSRFHFMRMFAQATGLTPMAYVTQQRIVLAKRLLQAGATPVVAALETGFFDQSHFARYFKKFVGTTPGNYQSHHRTIVQ